MRFLAAPIAMAVIVPVPGDTALAACALVVTHRIPSTLALKAVDEG